jgi:hypothetical protein
MTRALILPLALCTLIACSETTEPSDVVSQDTTLDAGSDDVGALDTTLEDVALPDVAPLEDTASPEDSAPPQDSAEIEDTQPAGPDIPEADVNGNFGNCSEPGGDRNIYDIQDPQCPDHISPEPVGQNSVDVVLKDVIVTGLFGDTMFVGEEQGGPYSGIAVFTHGMPHTDLTVGTIIDLVGSYSEYYECSQIYAESWTITGTGFAPEAYIPEHPQHISTNGAIAEMFEGVLVRIKDVKTTHTIPDCPQDYGEFEVSGGLRVDDMAYKWKARLGDEFAFITGILHYSFGNFKVEPRDEADIVATKTGKDNAVSKCIADECQAPDAAVGTKQIVVTEVMPDPSGSDYGQEWIELHNPTNEDVNMDGWELRDCGAQKLALVGANMLIPAGGYLVIGSNKNEATNGGVPVGYGYGEAFYLPNTIGSVLLYDAPEPFGNLVDQMRYSRFDPWDSFKSGASLERINPTEDGTVHTNWATGTASFGVGTNLGTPGQKNTATP